MILKLYRTFALLCMALSIPTQATAAVSPLPSCPEGAEIRGITMRGLAHTHSEVVERELRNHVGKPFDTLNWTSEQRALQDLDLFAEVRLTCSRPDSSGVVLEYTFLELFQYLPAPSLKQTDQDGWMVGGALAALNLFGYDIRTEVQARTTVAPLFKAKEYALYGSSPYMGSLPLDWRGELVQVDSKDDMRGFHDRSLNGDLDLKHLQNRRFGALFNGGFRRLDHQNPDSLMPWLSASSYDYVPHLGVALLWDSRDADLDTRSGLYNELRISQFGGMLGGPANYREYLWDSRAAAELGSGIIRLNGLLRYRPGSVGFYDRLQQGGANTLRGFRPDSAVHGTSEILTNAEWREAIVERTSIRILGVQGFWALQWVAGVDGAFLWDGERKPGWDDYRSAAYVGVHLVLPAIDRLRIEIGGNPKTKTWDLQVGLFEKATTQRWRSR